MIPEYGCPFSKRFLLAALTLAFILGGPLSSQDTMNTPVENESLTTQNGAGTQPQTPGNGADQNAPKSDLTGSESTNEPSGLPETGPETQNSLGGEAASSNGAPETSQTANPQGGESGDAEPIKAAQPPAQEAKPVRKTTKVREKSDSRVSEHFFIAPEDPSFLYETRYIPGHKKTEEFLSKELEKEVIVERIQEEQDFRKSLNKIKINMPDLRQVVVVAVVIGLFVLYRIRVRGMRKTARYR